LPIIHHRTPEFGEVFTRVNENLKRVFLTENDIFTYAASGTGAFEGAIQNLFSPGDKVLVVNNGNFGNRWVKMSQAFGLQVTELKYDWGVKADNDEVAEALSNDPEIKAAMCVLSETSTGTVNDIEGFARATENVDNDRGRRSRASGPAPGTDEWGVDVVVRGRQKALMTPPGPRVRERARAGHADARGVDDAALLLRLDGGEEGLRQDTAPDGVDAARERHHPARRRPRSFWRGHRERVP
jgi:aspartate aminotransferase-like enzyme